MCEKILTLSVAAYNVENYLYETLSSITRCKCLAEIEVIVVNDGSVDGTEMIAKQFCGKWPESFKCISKENGGYGSTINTSLSLACGKYFKLLDGDDWVDPAALDALVAFLKTVSADVVITGYIEVKKSTERIVRMHDIAYDGKEFALDLVLDHDFAMHSAAFKTSLLKRIGINITEHALYTDFEFMIKSLCPCESVAFFDADVYRYRLGRSGQSVQISSWLKNIDQACHVTLGVVEYCEYFLRREGLSEEKKRWLKRNAVSSARNKYKYLLFLGPSRENKNRLIEFDTSLQETSPLIRNEIMQVDGRARRACSHGYRFYLLSAVVGRIGSITRILLGH